MSTETNNNTKQKRPTFMKLFADSLCSVFANKESSIIDLAELNSLVDIQYLKTFNESKGYYTLKRAVNFDDLKIVAVSELKSLLNLKDLSLINPKELKLINTSLLMQSFHSLFLFFLAFMVVGGTALNFVVFNQLVENSVVLGEELSMTEVQYVAIEEQSQANSEVQEDYFEELVNRLDSQEQCKTELVGSNIENDYEYTYINGFRIVSICNLTE